MLQTRAVISSEFCCNKHMFYATVGVMKIALYGRVSTKDKRQDTENQLQQLREFAAAQQWTVVQEYVDKATGKRSDREQFQKLFADAAQRRFDLVLFWSLDRFSREGVFATLNHLQRLQSYGVGFRSLTEMYLDSCGVFKDAVLAILSTIAKQERIRLSERVHAGLVKARKEGRVGGRPQGSTAKPQVRKQILQLASEGLTMREIAEQTGISAASVCRFLARHRAPLQPAEEPALL